MVISSINVEEKAERIYDDVELEYEGEEERMENYFKFFCIPRSYHQLGGFKWTHSDGVGKLNVQTCAPCLRFLLVIQVQMSSSQLDIPSEVKREARAGYVMYYYDTAMKKDEIIKGVNVGRE